MQKISRFEIAAIWVAAAVTVYWLLMPVSS